VIRRAARRLTRLAAVLAAVLLAAAVVAGPAAAHRLRLFATVEGRTVSGYGFFVGGGRAAGAGLVARDPTGSEVFRGTTGPDGDFRFDVATPTDLALTLDAGDGHAATTALAAERFAAGPATPPAPPAASETVPPPAAAPPSGAPLAVASPTGAPPTTSPAPGGVDLDALAARLAPLVAAEVAADVDRAVARQIKPLLEESMSAESHIRLTDILGGLGWIAGLAGLGLAFARRRRP
jgi:nickel transport protein